jgi:cobalt-zinc-cadmium efflux system outer membrane protein
MTTPRIFALLAALSFMTGCVSEDAGYGDVRRVVSDRTGHEVRWNHLDGTPSAERTEKLLKTPLTERTAVEVALLNNSELQARFEDLGVARANMVEALRLPNPHAGAALHFHDGSPDIDVEVLQELTGFFFLPSRGSAGRAGIEAASLTVAGSVMDLALETRVRWYQHVAARQVVELSKTVLMATKAGYDGAKALHDAGNVTDLDLANQRSLYEDARLDALSAESNETSTRERLRAVLGLWNRDFQVAGRLPRPNPREPSTTDSEQKAVARSLDIAIAKKRYEAAAKRANMERARGWIPELKAGVSAERDEGEWGVGPAVELEVPLFYQGQGEVARARAEMRRAASEATSLATELRSATRVAVARLLAARERVLYIEKELLPLRARIVGETERQYNAMGANLFQLLSAKRSQVAAARSLVSALLEYWIARAELDQLVAGRRLRSSFTSLSIDADAAEAPAPAAH